MHPGIAETYRRRIERLTAALDHPDDALEAADAIREVIDRVIITPGRRRGSYNLTLQGELGTILDWIERSGKPGYKPKPDTASSRLSISVKTGARPGGERCKSDRDGGGSSGLYGTEERSGGRLGKPSRSGVSGPLCRARACENPLA